MKSVEKGHPGRMNVTHDGCNSSNPSCMDGKPPESC